MQIIWAYVKTQKWVLVWALVLAAINQIFSLLDPQIFRLIIDKYASNVGSLSRMEFMKGVLLLTLGSMGVALVSRIAKNFQDYFVNVATQRVGSKLYARSVAHALSLPYAVFEDQRSGELLQKLQKARTDIQSLIAGSINGIFLALIGILFVVIYASTVHWLLGVVYFSMIPILGFTMFFISRRIKGAQSAIVKQSAEMAGSTTETLRNVELVKSLGLENQEVGRLNLMNEKILELELKKVKLIRALSFVQGTMINTIRSGILLLMLWFVFQKVITTGEFFSLFIYSFFIFGPLTELGNITSQYQEAKASGEAVQNILAMESEPNSKDPTPVKKIEEIVFEKASFGYTSGKEEALQDISIRIQAGEEIALVGPSGSGKTTLLKLISGLYRPTAGKFAVNGIDSSELDFEGLRQKIGLVSQETQLFAGTIRENLLFVRPAASDEDCLRVLAQASALGILERGGEGLDTKIGEGGVKVSGGERQRLAIARALLREPEILIFDEATSSLDSLTEKEITSTIRNVVSANASMIVIQVAHRLSTIQHAQRIYVLEKGKLIESGSHAQLLGQKGLYAAMWREQSAERA